MGKMYGEDKNFVLLRATLCDRHFPRQSLLPTWAIRNILNITVARYKKLFLPQYLELYLGFILTAKIN